MLLGDTLGIPNPAPHLAAPVQLLTSMRSAFHVCHVPQGFCMLRLQMQTLSTERHEAMKKLYPGKTLADIFRVAFADRLCLGFGFRGKPTASTYHTFVMRGSKPRRTSSKVRQLTPWSSISCRPGIPDG